jgi:hypothetical protein
MKTSSVGGMLCVHCKEPLQFVLTRGWVHSDGLIYKQRMEHGQYVDDHAALPASDVQEHTPYK